MKHLSDEKIFLMKQFQDSVYTVFIQKVICPEQTYFRLEIVTPYSIIIKTSYVYDELIRDFKDIVFSILSNKGLPKIMLETDYSFKVNTTPF